MNPQHLQSLDTLRTSTHWRSKPTCNGSRSSRPRSYRSVYFRSLPSLGAASLGDGVILHIDMDAFYASVEEREDPALVGRPVVVGGSPEGRGVVCAANYEARKFGVHSAMSAARAVRLCPQATFIKPRMELYGQVGRQIRGIFHRYTPLVQPLSLDEAFLDVNGSVKLFGPPETIGRRIKREIADETGLVASVGVAPNKFLAKIASDHDKPDGFCVVDPGGIQDFLDPLPIGRVWGVGRAALRKFETLGTQTVGDLRRLPEDVLISRFGSWGRKLHRLARGIDHREVTPDRVAKSISHETTFRENITDPEVLRAWASLLAENVARRLRRHDLFGRTVNIKLRHSDFRTVSRAVTLPEPTNVTRRIADAAAAIIDQFVRQERRRDEFGRLSMRLLGLGVSNLTDRAERQGVLFDDLTGATSDRQEQARDAVADAIAEKFGKYAVRPGNTLDLPKKDRSSPFEAQ